ncbi:MAG: hypothetical protein ACLQU3_32945 [Limisphaerales bacterium]
MKKVNITIIGLIIILLVVGVALFWPRAVIGTTTITLSGNAGTPFSGFYIQNGQRMAVSAVLPWTFHGSGITQFEFRKSNPADIFAYEVVRDSIMGHSLVAGPLGSGVFGVRGEIHSRSMTTKPITHDA